MKTKLLRKIKYDFYIVKYPNTTYKLKNNIYLSTPGRACYYRYKYRVYYGFLKILYKEFECKKDLNRFILEIYKKKYYRYSKKYWL